MHKIIFMTLSWGTTERKITPLIFLLFNARVAGRQFRLLFTGYINENVISYEYVVFLRHHPKILSLQPYARKRSHSSV